MGTFLSASVGYVTLHSLLSMVGENCECGFTFYYFILIDAFLRQES